MKKNHKAKKDIDTRIHRMCMMAGTDERYNSTNRLLLQELVTKNPKGNLVFSPFSILMLLLIGSESTGGSTREEIAGFLGDKVPYEEIRKQLFMLNKELTSSPVLKSANG